MKPAVDFSIILPVMNQADHIEKVIKSFHRALTKLGITFEMITVVNGSHDESYAVCKRLGNKVVAYNLPKGGYGRGILYGLKKSHGNNLCYANSARTDADELAYCIKQFLKNPQVIIHGIRIKRDVWYRKIGSIIYNATCCLAVGINTPDINGIPKILSRKTFNKLNLTYKDSMIDLQLLDQANQKHIPVVQVPVYKNKRHGGISTSSFHTIFRLMKEVFVYWLNEKKYLNIFRH